MEKAKKPIFKRWWFWFIVVCVVIGGCNAAIGDDSDQKTKEETTVEESTEDTSKEETETTEEPAEEVTEEVVEEEEADPTANMDVATKNAYRSAQSYLRMQGFSKQGLIDQLSSEYADGYTVEQATAAVQALEDAGEVDWNEQAVRSGQSYLNMMGFSRQGLIDQLSSEYADKYTVEQATYAADQLGL